MKTLRTEALLPQIETWAPRDARLQAVVPQLQAASQKSLAYDIHSLDSVGLLEIEQANGVAFVGASPHTDKNFPRWFIMLTLKAADGVMVHTANTTKAKPNMTPAMSAPLVVGEILLFDAHKVHWVDVPADALLKSTQSVEENSVFSDPIPEVFHEELSIIVGTEVAARPTHDQAELLLIDYLMEKTPKAWGRMLSETDTPAPRAPKRPRR